MGPTFCKSLFQSCTYHSFSNECFDIAYTNKRACFQSNRWTTQPPDRRSIMGIRGGRFGFCKPGCLASDLALRALMAIVVLVPLVFPCEAQPYRFADHAATNVTNLADVPPSVGPDVRAAWHQTDALIATHWSSGDGFDGNPEKEYTYGEVTGTGARQLAREMGISSARIEDGEDRINFYDLGSGVARLVVQMVLDNPAVINKSVGVELSKDRHDIASSALSRIESSELLGKVELANADALQHDFSDATHIYISSLCFPRHVLEELQDIILTLGNAKVVAALNRLDKLEASTEWGVRDAPLQMTWGAGLAKIYRRISIVDNAVK